MTLDSLVDTLFAGRFRIISLLGTGGMGGVFLARHEVLQRNFAVKIIHKNLLQDPSIAARFRREARAASRIEHPHITSVFDFGHSDDGRPYIAMEYAEGPSLADAIAREKLFSITRALHILSQIAEALAGAHACNVIHRDLKPRNVILTTHRDQEDYVKILDFGLAKIIGYGTSSILTRDGETIGTPEYMAPEQCTSSKVDNRADIYSFGILAYEMLVGRVPFSGNMIEVIKAQVYKDPPIPSKASRRDDIPPAVDQLILHCLEKNIDNRFPNATVLAAEIQALKRSISGSSMDRFWRKDLAFSEKNLTGEYSGITNPFISDTPSLTEQNLSEEYGEIWDAPTESEWPSLVGETVERKRSRNLDDLAYTVRDQGLGSPRISQVLAQKLEIEDRCLEIESAIDLLDAQVIEKEMNAKFREGRLRQALNQLEHERALIQYKSKEDGDPNDPSSPTMDWDGANPERPFAEFGAFEFGISTLTQRIQQISQSLEHDLESIHAQLKDLRQNLDQLRQQADRYDEELAGLLKQCRSEVVAMEDPDLLRMWEMSLL